MLCKNNHLFSTTQTKTVEDMDNEGEDDHYEDSGEDMDNEVEDDHYEDSGEDKNSLWPWSIHKLICMILNKPAAMYKRDAL